MPRRLGILAAALVIGCAGQTPVETTGAARSLRSVLAVGAGVEDWVQESPASFYAGAEIYDYMNGEGEIPRACGFCEMAVAKYRHAGGGRVVVEVYDMGTSANAFGLHSMSREPSQRALDDTTHPAVLGPALISLWKGRFTVMLVTEESPPLPSAESRRTLALAFDRAISTIGEPPALLRSLPERGLVPESIRYFHGKHALDTEWFHAENIFRLDERTRAVVARYEDPAARVLVVEQADAEIAGEVLATARASLGTTRATELIEEVVGFVGTHGNLGIGVTTWRRHIGVVWDTPDADAAARRLTELAAALANSRSR